MELYDFLRGTLAWTASVACLWPLNAPLLALAFKIQQGSKTLDMEDNEYWTRSFVTSLVLALVTAAFIFVDHVLADWADFPAGLVHLIIYVAYVPTAIWILTEFFALDDLTHGLSIFIIYIYLPTFVLFVLNWVLGLINPSLRFWDWVLEFIYPWLKEATV